MSYNEIFILSSFWVVNLLLKSCTFGSFFIIFLHVWIRIRIRNTGMDPDPQNSWIRIQYGSTTMPSPHETFLKYMLFFPLITLHCPRSKFFFWISWMVVISGFTTVVDTHCFDGSGTETGNTLRMIYAKYYRKWAGWRGSKPENTYTVNFSTHPGNVAEPEPEPPGAATFRVVPEPIFFLVSRSREPEPPFWRRSSSGYFYLASKKGKPCDPKKT